MWAASAAASPAGYTRPASHSRSNSAAPDFVLAITGSVEAIASNATSGDGS